jgi:extracellular factor (EF) 3-hydroxypalmitic acid methyl ester biosynthesis protein
MRTDVMAASEILKTRKPARVSMPGIRSSLRERIKFYLKRAKEIEDHLSRHPDEWGKFQSEFNSEVNGIFREVMDYEKTQLAAGNHRKVDVLRDFFVRNFKDGFYVGDFCRWSVDKPFGYPGDFKIIYDIHVNSPKTRGFERLFDNYFQMSAIAVAVRNRKDDLKRAIVDQVSRAGDAPVRIMNLASGSAKEIQELFLEGRIGENVSIDCFDHDTRALDFSKELLSKVTTVKFFKKNALRIAAARDVSDVITGKYDLIYSAGLFDYLGHKTSVFLCRNLGKILNPGGSLLIANVRDKYSNPSVHFMEWAGDWKLIYRDEDEFAKIFKDANFRKADVNISYEQQGIIQYAKASKN